MLNTRRSFVTLLILAGAVLGACGSSTEPSVPAAGQLESVPGSSTGRIVLTNVGAHRIGVHTAIVGSTHARRGPTVTIPFSALVYAPNGATYAFTSASPLIYTEVAVTVDHISGNSVYLLRGPRAGSRVVSVGAEELFGVQTGVLGQT